MWKRNIIAWVLLVVLATVACAAPARRAPSAASLPEVNVLPAAADFAVGDNRFPFAAVNREGQLLEEAAVSVQFYQLEKGTSIEKGQAQAVFQRLEVETPHVHEGGLVHSHLEARGFYVVDRVAFDRPGVWEARVLVTPKGSATPLRGSAAFEVQAHSATPTLGAPAPRVATPTLADVHDASEVCSRTPPDDMHRVSITGALQAGRPFVAVFATPAFCVSRVCGPVTEVVASLQGRYAERVDFIHVEPYDLGKARREGTLALTEASKAWGLPTEPWVFLVDAQGKVAAKFEGMVTPRELEEAIRRMLGS